MRLRVLQRARDRKSTRLNSSHTVIYTLSLHDALPICSCGKGKLLCPECCGLGWSLKPTGHANETSRASACQRSEEHTSELQSHSDLHSFPTRRSSDLLVRERQAAVPGVLRSGLVAEADRPRK